MITALLVLAYLFLVAIGLMVFWDYRQASPIFWFPVSLCLMAIGTFAISDISAPSDVVYIAMFFVAMICFIAASALVIISPAAKAAYISFSQRDFSSPRPDEVAICVLVFIVSCVVTIAYYNAVGYNLFFLLLSGNIGSDYSDLRLATYSGDNYLAPGYANQFKNVLLPLTAMTIALWLKQSRNRVLFYIFSGCAAVGVAIALLGTGQRSYLVYTFFALSFGFILHNIGIKSSIKLRHFILPLIPVVGLLGLMTGAYAGVGEDGPSAILSKILERFTTIQQEGALFGFNYIYPMKTVWFAEWVSGFKGLMPGVEGSSLAHDIHKVMYGSDRGTVPLSSVGSAYYNGGVLGVVLLFFALGFLYSHLYLRFLRGERALLRSVTYGFMFFYLTIYVVDSPINLVDNGVVTIALLLVLRKVRIIGDRYSTTPAVAVNR
ncbi:O-antigen polymerase [Sphingosinicella sp. LY1275]|uniref:O-antigen polymerase n=1 Tax=Sphingosinicella sp. LY1275 TaxID=3095379 RepID=UPI002ADED660|nr:O-antigen polymerase [Sphingosinicella sp. LY1275]MEA1014478.1 O-antigen polymerase [Sphingosinicella sp. LY1275]